VTFVPSASSHLWKPRSVACSLFFHLLILEQQLAAVRNRENQRRSRARRKDYIQELEQRLRQYEVDRVRATTEVQAAARKVSEENMGLRSLLGLYGVDDGRIGEYLRTRDASVVSKYWGDGARTRDLSLSEDESPKARDYPGICMRTPPALETDVCSSASQHMSKTHQNNIPLHSDTQGGVSSISQDPATPRAINLEHCEGPARLIPDVHAVKCSLAPTSFEYPTTDGQGPESCPRDEISCLAAAEIIAGMRGHHNLEEVWPELGCSSSPMCTVKNMAIFQIMDQ
jgi:hypothetical protein